VLDHSFAQLPKRRYGAILADPPWQFETWSPKGQKRSGEAHYVTMSYADLAVLPVAMLAAPDSILFMWVVQTRIPESLDLIKAWGFQQNTVAFAWIKGAGLPLFPDDVADQMGMGKWTRAGFEQCFLGTRGNPKRLKADVRQVIVEKRREHSRKPDGIHERIERLVAGPYLELFARQRRPGWDCWGNEVDKFSESGGKP
jgi:N6-adenosine-specific RNA methylase IME4